MKYLLTQLLLLSFIKITLAQQTTNKTVVYVSPEETISFLGDFNNTATGEFWNNGNVYAYENWNNNGVVDFSILNINSGLTRFVGETSQNITGDNFNYLYNVHFGNALETSAFNLQGSISVTHEVDFTSGIVDNKLSNGLFVFEETANYIGASNESHVTGDVIKVGDTAFDYPIGNGSYYRSASMSNPTLNTETFIGEYFFEDTNLAYPVNNLDSNLELVDAAEYWSIERSEGNSFVTITLTWTAETTPNEILEGGVEAIHIARWDENQQLWVDQGGVVDFGNQSVSALVDNYGVFTLARIKGAVVLDSDFDFPPFITPNGDGYHDTWHINTSENIQITTIYIFDRYGKLLKQLAPNHSGWNGTYNGERLVGADYWFVANYKDLRDNTLKVYKSHFALKH